ncbi:MAG: HupE/UreJ family protein [Acetobacteraceae bacterium]|nr:HupE/UreJ family protein [Acetobacteraceae bacterium]
MFSWATAVLAGLLVFWGMCISNVAAAHQVNLTSARIVLGADRTVDVDVELKGSDIDRAIGTHVFDTQTDLVRADALANASGPVAAYVRAHAVVLGGADATCRAGPASVAPDQDGVAVRTRWSCADVPGRIRYRSTVLLDVAPDAKQVVLIGSGANPVQDLLDASRTELSLTEAAPGLLEVVGRYVVAGMEHIFTGYDHICFLIAIILWARKLWPVVKIVTAFTIAHSITLSLAALDIVRVPSAITEPAIAATIIYVAVENFLSRDVRQRWRDTFLFGLVHGFGFASALREFGLPRGALIPALGAFNLGVEIGQIAIVSLALPLLLGLDQIFAAARARFAGGTAVRPVGVLTLRATAIAVERPAVVVYSVSALIIAFGSYWFLGRTVLDLPPLGS